MATPPFGNILKGHVRTVPGNMLDKFEVRSLNRFGDISIQRSKIKGSPNALSKKFLRIRVRTVPRNTLVKFEVRSL